MSLLPNQILPPGTPLLNKDGTLQKDWYLWLYNVGQAALGNSNTSAAAFAAQAIADVDEVADTSSLKGISDRISALEELVAEPEDSTKTLADRVYALELKVLDMFEAAGVSGSITTAKISTATGSMVFKNGLLVSEVQAT